MNSVYEKAGADKEYAVAINATWANLLLNMAAGLFGISTDKLCWTFWDHLGNPHKCLTDASGESGGINNLPANSVITVDASGHATASANFFYTATTLRLPTPPFTLEFGDPTVNGSMRLRIVAGGAYLESRELGAWREVWAAF
jgi:hypothetical protein